MLSKRNTPLLKQQHYSVFGKPWCAPFWKKKIGWPWQTPRTLIHCDMGSQTSSPWPGKPATQPKEFYQCWSRTLSHALILCNQGHTGLLHVSQKFLRPQAHAAYSIMQRPWWTSLSFKIVLSLTYINVNVDFEYMWCWMWMNKLGFTCANSLRMSALISNALPASELSLPRRPGVIWIFFFKMAHAMVFRKRCNKTALNLSNIMQIE